MGKLSYLCLTLVLIQIFGTGGIPEINAEVGQKGGVSNNFPEVELGTRRKTCKLSCAAGQYCKTTMTYSCQKITGQPPPATGSECIPGVYDNYCCDDSKYQDTAGGSDLRYKVVQIGGKCKDGPGRDGICIFDDELNFARCDPN